MFADVEMDLDLGQRLAVPETAVLDTGARQIVYVEMGDGFFFARQIKVGDRADAMIEVLSGLKAGEKVASSAVFLIDSEAKLKGVSQ
jgi:Cu(I)/Ag(I) efflux system membrane fusion protein